MGSGSRAAAQAGAGDVQQQQFLLCCSLPTAAASPPAPSLNQQHQQIAKCPDQALRLEVRWWREGNLRPEEGGERGRMFRLASLPRGSGGFSRRQDTSTEEMTGCPRMTSTDTAALLGGLGSETLGTHPPPHILPTHSQCLDRRETGQSHLEAEVSAVRPLSKGQTPLCQALPAAGLIPRALQLPHESRHLLLHGLRLQGRSQRTADNPPASHSGRRLLLPRLFQENTTISRIQRLQQGSAIGQ